MPNFPNPFNPQTSIAYTIPRRTHVALTIYDAAGRLVAKLVNGVQPAGRNVVTWNGRDRRGLTVAPGVYFARLVTDE